MVSIQIKMWACFGIIWSFKWEHFLANNVDSNPNVSLFWQNMISKYDHFLAKSAFKFQCEHYLAKYNKSKCELILAKCEHILAKSRLQSQCEHYLAKSKKEHFLANLIGSMNFLTFCQNLLFGPKLDFWLKCDFVPLRVSQQRKEAGKNADFAIGGYSNNYSKKHREFRWSQRFFPLSIKYDFLEFLGCLFPPSAPLAKKNSEFLASRKPINPRGQVDLPRPT